jgi:hypothetical protein
VIDVNHVPGFTKGHPGIVADGRVELHRVQDMLRRVVRRGENRIGNKPPLRLRCTHECRES